MTSASRARTWSPPPQAWPSSAPRRRRPCGARTSPTPSAAPRRGSTAPRTACSRALAPAAPTTDRGLPATRAAPRRRGAARVLASGGRTHRTTGAATVPTVLVAVCAVLGLLVGSFLNVVIVRVPAGESILRPRSRCPRCGAPIAPRDNVPVLSWLLLRGRARCCGVPISARYPAVELVTAASFALVAAWCTGAFGAGAGAPAAASSSGPLVPSAWGGSLWPLPAFEFLAAASVALVA